MITQTTTVKKTPFKMEKIKKSYENVFIAFIDILGFKDLINNNSQDEVIIFFEKTLESIFEFTSSLMAKVYQKSSDKSNIEDNFSLNSLLISDSLIFWSDDHSPANFYNLLLTVQQLLHSAMGRGIPLRGTITMGPIAYIKKKYLTNKENNSVLLLGKAFTDAYTNESKQNWSGCVINKECIKRFDEVSSKKTGVIQLERLFDDKMIVKYKVPYKAGPIIEEYVIDWVNFLDHKNCFTIEKIRESFSKYKKSSDNWDVEAKILNTIAFFEYVSPKKENL